MPHPSIFPASDFDKDEYVRKTGARVIDTYKEQLEDLFLIRNPRFRFDKNYLKEFEEFLAARTKKGGLEKDGAWVFFPWNNLLVHYLSADEHFEVRTARNKNILTGEEQKKYYDCRIAVAGLSVGSHAAMTTALTGGGRVMKLADMDTISASNLNRIHFDFTVIGKHKGEAVAEYIYQLNPYAELTLFSEGVTEKNVGAFLDGIDVLVEELDDIGVKILLREEARRRGIPVLMATDSSDNVLLDVERYDLNPYLPLFHGALRGITLEEIRSDRKKMFEAMGRIIDLRLVTERQLETVSHVGKTIYSWPQLGTAAAASGAVLAYAIRKIALKQPLRDKKSKLNLDALVDADYKKTVRMQRAALGRFMRSMGVPYGILGIMRMLWMKIFSKK